MLLFIMTQPLLKTTQMKIYMKKTASILFIALISINFIRAQDTVQKTMPLFQSEELLNLRLESDFKSVFPIIDDSTYFPANISFEDNDGKKVYLDVEIRTRGKTRREKDICKFTPLRLRFPKKKTKNSVFKGQRAIKLVTHCNKADVSEQNTIIEYLTYKAFNILTDSSFKVRGAMINYVFTDQKKDSTLKFAFFIERDKHLAKRLNGIELESVRIHPIRLHVFHACLMDMFQYMIGNTDYSSYDLHNIKLVSDKLRKAPHLAIPYDFDWCGLVSAFYAVPHPMFNIEKVTTRIYRGFKKEPEVVAYTIKKFNSKKDEIYKLFEDNVLLSKREKKRVIKYLNQFYRIINDDKLVEIEFMEKARILHN